MTFATSPHRSIRRTIWKFTLPLEDEFSVPMPSSAELLSVDVQGGHACLWALVEPRQPLIMRRFALRGTGHPCDDLTKSSFVGSFQLGGFVGHLFDLDTDRSVHA